MTSLRTFFQKIIAYYRPLANPALLSRSLPNHYKVIYACKFKKESMSSTPSGSHVGHYKALLKVPPTLSSLPFQNRVCSRIVVEES